MLKHNQTWVAVANGSVARIFCSNDKKHHIELVQEISSEAARLLSSELARDKPGRAFESSSATRHSIEPKHDLHQQEKQIFAKQLASLINEGANIQKYAELVLICSPEVLGHIRAELSKPAHSMIVKEINKDLTHMGEKEILAYLHL
jgi:protein required for attachment to host cells